MQVLKQYKPVIWWWIFGLFVILLIHIGLFSWFFSFHFSYVDVQRERSGHRVVIDIPTESVVSATITDWKDAGIEDKDSDNEAFVHQSESLGVTEEEKKQNPLVKDQKKEETISITKENKNDYQYKSDDKINNQQEKIQNTVQTENTTQSVQQSEKAKKPKIAILVTGLGVSRSSTERALQLPTTVSLGFSPYGYNLKEWLVLAQKKGYSLYIHIPMEPIQYPMDMPGPYALLSDLSEQENIKRFEWVISRFDAIEGVYTTPDEKFSYAPQNMKPLLERLRDKNLLLVYGGGGQNASLQQLVKSASYEVVMIDRIIDSEITAESIINKLHEAEEIARKQGTVLVMASPYPVSIRLLDEWSKELIDKNIELVSITALLIAQKQQ
jgi:polysaccharide deacetylase 2 family uncharacterized protein YibQ